ncbi:hypothetical protein [Streptomyces sp. TRM68367]|uniref:hypothetical protein n=1 Tax=Streptomyces sp. TRM68367 TaxID=2758415 RepID=UPI00165C65EE|nr:hypothetical protein [Streptomyces sp. TRM68367]MBC9730621.1 hypothetical protein [Streptomyces sp. TRM68367]
MTPKVPGTERRFSGAIIGDKPYAGRGGLLLVGPGYLASTPDPTGVAFRREVPPTLTPLRVRPPYWTDPDERPDYTGRVQVLECEDNGVPVLIATHRKHMPWVLGALKPTGVRHGGRP